MSREDLLANAVQGKLAPVYMSTKGQIVDYYKDTYGQRNWTRHIAEDLHGHVVNKNGDPVSIPNLMRRFQGDRAAKGEGKSSSMFVALGQRLPPVGEKLNNNAITIIVKGEQATGTKGHTRQRTISVTFKDNEAYQFVRNPSFMDIWEQYGVDPGMFEDGQYAIDVHSVSAY